MLQLVRQRYPEVWVIPFSLCWVGNQGSAIHLGYPPVSPERQLALISTNEEDRIKVGNLTAN
jgi:hypothetical protein